MTQKIRKGYPVLLFTHPGGKCLGIGMVVDVDNDRQTATVWRLEGADGDDVTGNRTIPDAPWSCLELAE